MHSLLIIIAYLTYTLKLSFYSPDLLYEKKLKATRLSNVPSQAYAENIKMTILKLVSERQVRMAGKMAIIDSDTTFNCLKMLANLEIKRRDEFVRQRNDKLHQNAEAWRLETKIVEQLNEALVLIEDAIKRKNASLKEAISVLEFERQARKVVETTKEDLKMSLNHLKDLLNKELTKKDELKRERD